MVGGASDGTAGPPNDTIAFDRIPENDVAVPRNRGPSSSARQESGSRFDLESMRNYRDAVIAIRETEAGGCASCGANLSQWETGYPIDLVVEAVFLDPALLEPLLVRRCRNCGARYDWGVLITGDDLEDDWPAARAVQAELLETLREMLRTSRLQPAKAAKQIRRRFGVEGVYTEEGSEIAWRLQCLAA